MKKIIAMLAASAAALSLSGLLGLQTVASWDWAGTTADSWDWANLTADSWDWAGSSDDSWDWAAPEASTTLAG
ncbi:hypothetical protein [Janibacter anophelis]|uniref:hypothetical protein n=1 Tax=Janibacter anophelis TaxID=319054 RepID=UPI00082B4301|nr:hypothetical protein [Janibacter anophelis]